MSEAKKAKETYFDIARSICESVAYGQKQIGILHGRLIGEEEATQDKPEAANLKNLLIDIRADLRETNRDLEKLVEEIGS